MEEHQNPKGLFSPLDAWHIIRLIYADKLSGPHHLSCHF